MKFALRRDSFLVLASSFIIAVMLHVQVGAQNDPWIQREIEVPLQLRNLNEQLVVARAPDKVIVVAEGPPRLLERTDSEQLAATIELGAATSGLRGYPVQLIAPTRSGVLFSLKQPMARLEITRMMRLQMKVTVDPRGVPPDDLLFGGAIAEPDTVTLYGPETDVPKAIKVRASLDLSQLTPGTAYPLPVEVIGEGNQQLATVRSDPRTVTVRPAVSAAPAGKRLLVTPTWIGQPQFGYRVTDYDIQPSQIQVTGPSGALAAVSKLDTDPIDLTGVAADVVRVVRVRLPRGILLPRGASNTVRVTVRIASALQEPLESPTIGGVP